MYSALLFVQIGSKSFLKKKKSPFIPPPKGSGFSGDLIYKSKQSYGKIESDIVGIPILGMSETFSDCKNLKTIPFQVPNSVINMDMAFNNCEKLTNINITIPEHVESFIYLFNGCCSLKGNITVNTNTTNFVGCLFGVTKDDVLSEVRHLILETFFLMQVNRFSGVKSKIIFFQNSLRRVLLFLLNPRK